MNLAAQSDLLPRPPGGMGRGAALAALVHAGLLGALALGLQWRVSTPTVVSAELWSSVPQVAAPQGAAAPEPPPPAPAPAPVPPPPAPEPPATRTEAPPPDIVVERQRREREAREKAERDAAALRERQRREQALKEQQERERQARERAEADRQARLKKEREQRERAEREERERKLAAERQRKEEAAATERLARQREDNLKRMQEQIGGVTGRPGGTGSQAADAAPSASYAGRLVMHIKPNIVFTETLAGNPAAEVEVRASPSGSILSRRLVKSSGQPEWDEAVLRAIDRTGTLPRDVDGRVPSAVVIVFRPRE